jgi:hypothetical protein
MGTLFFRRMHAWVGLIVGLQIILWTVSGGAMAFIDMQQVKGGPRPEAPPPPALPAGGAWDKVRAGLGDAPVAALTVRPLLDRQVLEVGTGEGVRLFDAATGAPIQIDQRVAAAVAAAGHPEGAKITRIEPLREITPAVRRHSLPIWRVDFADEAQSSYYVSAQTGKLLERRNDSWRWWDFFWMLHNMDYWERESFNHPLIVVAAIAAAWLSLTGLWLLVRTAWRPDLRALRSAFGRRR